MLWTLVKQTEWEPLLRLVSPAFFDVVPAKMLLRELKGLTARYLSRTAFAEAKTSRAEAMARAGLPFTLVDTLPQAPSPVDDRTRGDDLLALYFHQVLGEGPVLLDLRRESFARVGDAWQWKPSPAIADWPADFRQGCRALYEGFYLGDDARFAAGASALGLGQAEAELRAQFGDARAVRFSLREFQERFQQVFQRCKETRSQIHPGFLTLGLGLATLYEHLDSVDVALDVHAAFDLVHREDVQVAQGAAGAAAPAGQGIVARARPVTSA
jgi:hypothetical protein